MPLEEFSKPMGITQKDLAPPPTDNTSAKKAQTTDTEIIDL
jgi:hypothetical protein